MTWWAIAKPSFQVNLISGFKWPVPCLNIPCSVECHASRGKGGLHRRSIHMPHFALMPNRLSEQTSPYLLQHAHNPVDWYPWGSEALQRARDEDRPIFLSIGYAACHWCHVMERESFEDPQIAALMNDGFVSIKVDREERPDLDDVYMAAVQAMTGS